MRLKTFVVRVFWAASLALVLAFGAALLVIPFARRAAVKIGFVDQPGGRKEHENPADKI